MAYSELSELWDCTTVVTDYIDKWRWLVCSCTLCCDVVRPYYKNDNSDKKVPVTLKLKLKIFLKLTQNNAVIDRRLRPRCCHLIRLREVVPCVRCLQRVFLRAVYSQAQGCVWAAYGRRRRAANYSLCANNDVSHNTRTPGSAQHITQHIARGGPSHGHR